jgi:hypothetical protein
MNFRSCNELLSKVEPRFVLLTRLGRDLSQYYFCYACLQLHLWTHISLPTPHFKLRNCFDSLDHKDMQFHFVHLHFAVRRFYFGPSFGIPVESLIYAEVIAFPLNSPKITGAHMSEKQFKICQRTGLLSVDVRVWSWATGSLSAHTAACSD